MVVDGPYFTATLTALALNGDEREATIRNATDIANAVIGAYGKVVELLSRPSCI
jgi:hypothetical protein